MRRLFLLLVCLSCLFALPARAADGLPSLDQILDQFDSVVLGHEHGTRAAIIRKWDQAPAMAIFVTPGFDGSAYHRQIMGQLAELAGLSGLDMHAARPAEASLRLGFFPRREFRKLPGDREDPEFRRFVDTSACLGISRLAGGGDAHITSGLIMIGTDISEDLRRHCLLEEMVQIMGLPNDACHYRPSLFCEADHVTRLTPADRILVQTLYDTRLHVGMARDDVRPLAREIIGALVSADARDETGDAAFLAP